MEYQAWLAVFLSAGTAVGVSSIWQAEPVAGTVWGNAMRVQSVGRRQYVWRGLAAAITALVLVPLLYLANGFYGNSFLVDAVLTAFWLWLGFTGATWYIRYGFERRPDRRVVLAMGHELLILEAMAVVIGLCKL